MSNFCFRFVSAKFLPLKKNRRQSHHTQGLVATIATFIYLQSCFHSDRGERLEKGDFQLKNVAERGGSKRRLIFFSSVLFWTAETEKKVKFPEGHQQKEYRSEIQIVLRRNTIVECCTNCKVN